MTRRVAPFRSALAQESPAWNLLGYAISSAATLAFTVMAAKSIDLSQLGYYFTVAAVFSFLPVLDRGARVPTIVAAARSLDSSETSDGVEAPKADVYFVLRRQAWIGLGAGVLSLGSGAVISQVLGWEDGIVVILLGVSASLSFAVSPYSWVLVGCQRFRSVAASNILFATCQIVLGLLLIRELQSVGAGLAVFAATGISRAALFLTSRRLEFFGAREPTMPKISSAFRRQSTASWLSNIASIAFGSASVLLVSATLGPQAAAIHRLCFAIPVAAASGLHSFLDVFVARASKARLDDEAELAARTAAVIACFGALGFGVLAWATPLLVQLLSLPDSAAPKAMIIMNCGAYVAAFAFQGYLPLLWAKGRQDVVVPIVVIEGVLNIVLALAFMRLVGLPGGALGMLVALSISNLIGLPAMLRVVAPKDGSLRLRRQYFIAIFGYAVLCGAAGAYVV